MTLAAWQQNVDVMWERDAARKWEELNAPLPYEAELVSAGKELKAAISGLEKAIGYVEEAAAELQGTPEAPKVESYISSLDEILHDLTVMKNLYWRGMR